MKSWKRAILLGFLSWVIPFVVAIFIFPLRVSDRPLFESIMPVMVVLCAVFFSVLYFNRVESGYAREGIYLGLIWLAINVLIDLIMFMQGPMRMELVDYVKNIGITYLMIPVITSGLSLALSTRQKRQ